MAISTLLKRTDTANSEGIARRSRRLPRLKFRADIALGQAATSATVRLHLITPMFPLAEKL
jgi:hypothetical protein